MPIGAGYRCLRRVNEAGVRRSALGAPGSGVVTAIHAVDIFPSARLVTGSIQEPTGALHARLSVPRKQVFGALPDVRYRNIGLGSTRGDTWGRPGANEDSFFFDQRTSGAFRVSEDPPCNSTSVTISRKLISPYSTCDAPVSHRVSECLK